MDAPAILMYNMDNQQKLKLLFICSRLKIHCHTIAPEDYQQPIGALIGLRPRLPGSYTGAGFSGEMLVMANFTNPLLNAFLGALRQDRSPAIALKAVMTPSNIDWDSVKLHDEILREHEAMHEKKS